MGEVIDYQRRDSEAERKAARRRLVARRDRAIRWFVAILALIVVAVSVFLYTFPARLIDIQGYTR